MIRSRLGPGGNFRARRAANPTLPINLVATRVDEPTDVEATDAMAAKLALNYLDLTGWGSRATLAQT